MIFMEFRVLDQDFNTIDIIETYTSMIWTSRFGQYGDFELFTFVDPYILQTVRIGYYIFCSEFYNQEDSTASLMIIESMEITTNEETGNTIKFTGRDLKSILDRRIVWGQRVFPKETKIVDLIHDILDENLINPQYWSRTYQDGDVGNITVEVDAASRAIQNFVNGTDISSDTRTNEERQYNGENLYELIVALCEEFRLGFDVVYNFNESKFIFSLKNMVNKTYGQTENIPILFSPSIDNIKESNYLESSSTEKNAGIIIGEGDEYNVMYNVIGNEQSGLDRREMCITASGTSQSGDNSSGDFYSNATYLSMLKSKGEEELAENTYTQAYEATVQSLIGYEYKKDYDIGDICEIMNEYGIESKVLVSEIMLSSKNDEVSIIPTFTTIN